MKKLYLQTLCVALLAAWTLAQERAVRVNEADVNSQTAPDANYFGGDIRLTAEQRAALADESVDSPREKAVVRSVVNKWPNARVPYALSSSLRASTTQARDARRAIAAAIAEYDEKTCVRFVPRNNENNYVFFISDAGCYSYIGRTGGRQEISIGPGCEDKGVVMHEMFHALGRWHEQSRPDRDSFVRINYNNIENGLEENFEKLSSRIVSTQGVSYDYRSIMHYHAYAFSRNREPTIEPLDRRFSLDDLGNRDGFSSRDLEHVNALYCEGGTPSWSAWGSWSACSRTCNGGTRTRTRTCNGGTTCSGSNTDSEQCNTNACPIWGPWSRWGSCSVTCGGGRQSRTRSCLNGDTCVGPSRRTRDCNTDSCPTAAAWGPWSRWSSCSVTCGGGRQSRTRSCLNGDTCVGPSRRTRDCNTDSCPTAAAWGPWSRWSPCSVTCGGGRQSRTRSCLNGDTCVGQSRRTRDCNTDSCPPGRTSRGCYRVPSQTNSLGLVGANPDYSIDECALEVQEIGYSMFGIARGYCISGSNRLRDYQTAGSAGFCRNGVGGYSNGYAMNVYQIRSASGDVANDGMPINLNSTVNEVSSSTPTGVLDLTPPAESGSIIIISSSLQEFMLCIFVTFVCFMLI